MIARGCSQPQRLPTNRNSNEKGRLRGRPLTLPFRRLIHFLASSDFDEISTLLLIRVMPVTLCRSASALL